MDDAKLSATLAALGDSGIWPTQRYRHYRGGVYEVIGAAILEATLEPAVVYRSLETGISWVRPLADFAGTVEVGGEVVARFTREG